MQKITLKIETVWGQTRIYPACDLSRLFLSLTGNRKTFEKTHIETIKKLGYTIEVLTPSI